MEIPEGYLGCEECGSIWAEDHEEEHFDGCRHALDEKSMTFSELLLRFTYHPPDSVKQEAYVSLRGKALELADMIRSRSPDCREKSLAITKLEECVMWANAGIARRS